VRIVGFIIGISRTIARYRNEINRSDVCSVIEVMIVVINTPICPSFYVVPTEFQRVGLLNLRFQVQKFVLAHLVWYVEITLCQNGRSTC